LIIEVEAITSQLAKFSLGEVQKKVYALIIRKLLPMTLEMSSLPCLVLERPDVLSFEFTQRRILIKISNFSDKGRRCIERLQQQWALRIPHKNKTEMKVMVLDRRIKANAAAIVNDRYC
jgi:hypothetical protein